MYCLATINFVTDRQHIVCSICCLSVTGALVMFTNMLRCLTNCHHIVT